MNPEDAGMGTDEMELVRIETPAVLKEAKRFINKVLLLDHFDKVIAGVRTDDVCVGEIGPMLAAHLGLSVTRVMATPKALFSLLEGRGDKARSILEMVPDILAEPDEVMSGNDGKKGPRYTFVKNTDETTIAVFEVVLEESTQLLITAFAPSKPKNYLRKYRGLYKKA